MNLTSIDLGAVFAAPFIMHVMRNLEHLTGHAITTFCAARDSRVEELTALYAELKRPYDVKSAYEYYAKKET